MLRDPRSRFAINVPIADCTKHHQSQSIYIQKYIQFHDSSPLQLSRGIFSAQQKGANLHGLAAFGEMRAIIPRVFKTMG
jgi:hypothetical protein